MTAGQTNEQVLYQPDEAPPLLVSLGHSLLSIMSRLTGMTASAAIIAHASGQTDAYLSWILFISLSVCGLGAICQTFQIWRFGTGYPVGMSSGTPIIAICVSALIGGGPTMLSSLIIVSALVQFAFISNLSLLRRIITPRVSGAILMLLSATVVSIVSTELTNMSEGVPETSAVAVGATTFGVVLAFSLFGASSWRQWGPIIGILAGCVVAGALGIFDVEPALKASWIGVPFSSRPDFDLSLDNFNAEFWAVLPGFVIVHLMTSIYSISGLMVIQQVSWRRPRAIDFRVIQGGLNLVGLTSVVAALLEGCRPRWGRAPRAG